MRDIVCCIIKDDQIVTFRCLTKAGSFGPVYTITASVFRPSTVAKRYSSFRWTCASGIAPFDPVPSLTNSLAATQKTSSSGHVERWTPTAASRS